jgi:hypothetical protein
MPANRSFDSDTHRQRAARRAGDRAPRGALPLRASQLRPLDRRMSHPLYELLSRLEAACIHFTLAKHRPETVLVTLTFVGERSEIDVFDDGHMEVSRFKGNEGIVGEIQLVTNSFVGKMCENSRFAAVQQSGRLGHAAALRREACW